MKVSKNAYYYQFKNKDIVFLKTRTVHLKERIKTIFEDSREIYGSRKFRKN
jgi:hypothetical protein